MYSSSWPQPFGGAAAEFVPSMFKTSLGRLLNCPEIHAIDGLH